MSELLTKVQKCIEGIEAGNSLTSQLKAHEVSHAFFFDTIRSSPSYAEMYDRAREARADTLVDEAITIVDTEPDPNKARVRSDIRRWLASKLQPRTYGDKLDLNVNATVDIGSALLEARKRASLLTCDPAAQNETQLIDVTPETQQPTTGYKSVGAPIRAREELTAKNDDDDIFS